MTTLAFPSDITLDTLSTFIHHTFGIHEMQSLTRLAEAFADEVRVQLLVTLLERDATVSELAARLGVSQPRVSTHLARLRQAGLVAAEANERQRTYSVDRPRVTGILTALRSASRRSPRAVAPVQTMRTDSKSAAIRHARTCYGHLAGVVGVQLLTELLQRNWLQVQRGDRRAYELTDAGEEALRKRHVDLLRARKARRRFAVGCLDWTERRPHLGGALGVAIFSALVSRGIASREMDSRVVRMRRPVAKWF